MNTIIPLCKGEHFSACHGMSQSVSIWYHCRKTCRKAPWRGNFWIWNECGIWHLRSLLRMEMKVTEKILEFGSIPHKRTNSKDLDYSSWIKFITFVNLCCVFWHILWFCCQSQHSAEKILTDLYVYKLFIRK